MKVALSKEELSLLLDALAQLPLAKSYNLFQRLLGELQAPSGPNQPAPAPDPVED